jgi:hypothetical protein
MCSPRAEIDRRRRISKKGGPVVGHGGRCGFAMDGGAPMLLRPREGADEVRLGPLKLPAASACSGRRWPQRISGGGAMAGGARLGGGVQG